MKIKGIYIVLIIGFYLFIGCNPSSKSNQQRGEIENKEGQNIPEIGENKSEDFKSFYSRFLTDKTFQLSRIEFPLSGEIIEDGVHIQHIEKKDWPLMKSSIYDVDKNEYKVEIKEDSTEVYHRIYVEYTGIDIEVKYNRIDGKWYLVYYRSVFI